MPSLAAGFFSEVAFWQSRFIEAVDAVFRGRDLAAFSRFSVCALGYRIQRHEKLQHFHFISPYG